MHKKLIPPAITPGEWSASDGVVWTTDAAEVVATTCDRADSIKFDPRCLKPHQRASCVAIAAIPSTHKALETALEMCPPCNPQLPQLVHNGAERCPENHPYCCGYCAAYYQIRAALIQAGYTESL